MDQKRPKLLRMDEVREITGWSRATCYAKAAGGQIPSLRMGRTVRVPLQALELFIQRNTTGGDHLG